jgi:hypothetical protein
MGLRPGVVGKLLVAFNRAAISRVTQKKTIATMKHHDDHQKAEEGSEATDPPTRPQVVDDEQQQPST